MLRFRIKELAVKNGITNAYQLQKALDTLPTTAARWWRGDMAMISMKTIDRLCEVLNCSPGELFERRSRRKGGSR